MNRLTTSDRRKRVNGKVKHNRGTHDLRSDGKVRWGPFLGWASSSGNMEVEKNVWLQMVFSYLTELELSFYQRVCKAWRRHALAECKRRKSLDLASFFWCFDEFTPSMVKLLHMFPNVSTLRLGYCHQLTDDILHNILNFYSRGGQNGIEKLDLFYCYDISSKGVAHIVELCPNLTELTLNFCVGVDNQSIKHLSTLKQLKELHMSSLPLLTEGIWLLFREHRFSSLKHLYIGNNKKLDRAEDSKNLVQEKDGTVFSSETNHFRVTRDEEEERNEYDEDELYHSHPH